MFIVGCVCFWVGWFEKAFKLSHFIRGAIRRLNLHRSKLTVISIIALLLFSLSVSVSLAAAQPLYQTITVEVTIGSNGLFIASEPDFGVSFTIEGTPGAEGLVVIDLYNGNPQVTADVPSGVSLSHFIAIKFDMLADDFAQATVTISYSDNDLVGVDEPYSIYKYLASTDSFVALSTDVDTTAKTMTVVLTGVDDPILAVGGLTVESPPPDLTTVWVIVAVAVIIIVVLAVFLVLRWRRM